MSHRKEAESKQSSVKRVQGYIVREEQLVATDDEVFSDDDDFSFDPISVEKLTIFKKKGYLISFNINNILGCL